ncbi:MAG: hypothetical protein PWQ16_643 [bacterium]|nr:hypothetical protein [bacterium]
MEIFGLGILGGCMILGLFVGNLLGRLIGLNSNVGGVGFAMLFLVFLTNYLELKGKPLPERVGRGIEFVSAMYIPVVVAMASIQNVVAAVKGGLTALLAGGGATLLSFFLVPLIAKMGKGK